MNLRKTIIAAISVAIILLMATSAMSVTVHQSGLPKVDEIYYKAYPGEDPDVIVDEFIDGVTDWLGGPSRKDLYNRVQGNNTYGTVHTISEKDPMAEFTFFPINCRDYEGSTEKPNFPLNDSSFRLALSYIYGVNDKDDDIWNYYEAEWHHALGNPVPPVQEPWYDAPTQMPDTSNDTAWNTILSPANYTVAEYDGQQWLHKNVSGVLRPVRPPDGPHLGKIQFFYSTGALFYPQGPGGGMVKNFNAFITDYLGAEGPLMEIVPVDFLRLVLELMLYHDYDILGIGLTNMGRYTDWIYDLSHSSNDVTWGWNFAGIHDDDFDTWGETILTSMNETIVEIATANWTRKFVYELMPWMPVRYGDEFCTMANATLTHFGELTNLVQMDIYGPSNDYSWMAMHWKGTPGIVWPGGNYSRALGDAPDTLNPLTDNTLYGWQFMDRAIVGLTTVSPVPNPQTGFLDPMPMIATNWTVAHWTSIPELGIAEGSTATFSIRQDVQWHDSWVNDTHYVDAYDCVANMRFMREYHPGRYSSTWAHLVYEEAEDPYQFNVYFDSTSLYYAGYVSGTSLLVPEEILDVVEGYWEDWQPCDNATKYAGLGLGPPPPDYPDLTQLVGCGPFVFHHYDRGFATGKVEAFNKFFINAPVIGSVDGDWQVDPLADYTYRPVIHNFGAKEANERGELASATVDVEVFEDDVSVHTETDIVLDPWNWTYIGPYTKTGVTPGPHNITVNVTGDAFTHTYVHQYVATVEEDITTVTGDKIDFTVNMRDVGRAARAFGSAPGHLRWDPAADIAADDFKVNMRDIGQIAKSFGWKI
jgi:hypothetical protein